MAIHCIINILLSLHGNLCYGTMVLYCTRTCSWGTRISGFCTRTHQWSTPHNTILKTSLVSIHLQYNKFTVRENMQCSKNLDYLCISHWLKTINYYLPVTSQFLSYTDSNSVFATCIAGNQSHIAEHCITNQHTLTEFTDEPVNYLTYL